MTRAPISTSAEFDDARYFTFARSSGLPFGYFGKRTNWRARALWVATAVAAVVAVAILI
jgi:hypothetical protein